MNKFVSIIHLILFLTIALPAFSIKNEYVLLCKNSIFEFANGNKASDVVKELHFILEDGYCTIFDDNKNVNIKDLGTSIEGWSSGGVTQIDDGPKYYSHNIELYGSSLWGSFRIGIYSTFDFNNSEGTNTEWSDPESYDANITIFFNKDGARFEAKIIGVVDMQLYRSSEDILYSMMNWDDFTISLTDIGKVHVDIWNKRKQKLASQSLSMSKPAQAVDLGLSVKWASYNLGGDTLFNVFCRYGWADPTGSKSSENNNEYPEDTNIYKIGGTKYDIARTHWRGAWRLPTKEECEEFVSKCTFKVVKNVLGENEIKAIGPNGNSIILPLFGTGSYACYWTDTRESTCCGAYSLIVDDWRDSKPDVDDSNNRFCKFYIRPVYDD